MARTGLCGSVSIQNGTRRRRNRGRIMEWRSGGDLGFQQWNRAGYGIKWYRRDWRRKWT